MGQPLNDGRAVYEREVRMRLRIWMDVKRLWLS
jgi:hypothetical protein